MKMHAYWDSPSSREVEPARAANAHRNIFSTPRAHPASSSVTRCAGCVTTHTSSVVIIIITNTSCTNRSSHDTSVSHTPLRVPYSLCTWCIHRWSIYGCVEIIAMFVYLYLTSKVVVTRGFITFYYTRLSSLTVYNSKYV